MTPAFPPVNHGTGAQPRASTGATFGRRLLGGGFQGRGLSAFAARGLQDACGADGWSPGNMYNPFRAMGSLSRCQPPPCLALPMRGAPAGSCRLDGWKARKLLEGIYSSACAGASCDQQSYCVSLQYERSLRGKLRAIATRCRASCAGVTRSGTSGDRGCLGTASHFY